jgi:hypothetical protein
MSPEQEVEQLRVMLARAWWDKKTAVRAKEKAGAQADNPVQD